MKKYPKFHHARIKKILNDDYDCHLERIPTGYKANRIPGFHATYKLIVNSTNEIITPKVSLDTLSQVLAMDGYSPTNQNKQNPGARRFLEFVEQYEEQHKHHKKS